MTGFSEEDIQSLVQVCTDKASEIAASLGRCFERELALRPGEACALDLGSVPDVLEQPGLVVSLQVGDQGVIGLIPASLPLPNWYVDPDENERSRLQTLAMECSHILLPGDLEASTFAAIATDDLKSVLSQSQPLATSMLLELEVPVEEVSADGQAEGDVEATPPADESDAEDGSDSGETQASVLDASAGRFYLVWPVEAPPQPDASATTSETTESAGSPDSIDTAAPDPTAVAQLAVAASKVKRLKQLPVSVVVRLAEKKIEMGQLLSLAPGAMITFNKPCEDLLDLYVNNRLYCRGEAVKIGEKFGLKVNDVGVVPVRRKTVIHG